MLKFHRAFSSVTLSSWHLLKLNTQKTIMASGPITSWQINGQKMKTVTDFMQSRSPARVVIMEPLISEVQGGGQRGRDPTDLVQRDQVKCTLLSFPAPQIPMAQTQRCWNEMVLGLGERRCRPASPDSPLPTS